METRNEMDCDITLYSYSEIEIMLYIIQSGIKKYVPFSEIDLQDELLNRR